LSLAAPPLELAPPPSGAPSPPPLTDGERHRLRRAACLCALGFALVMPAVTWLSVGVSEAPTRRRIAAFAIAELLAAALILYWTHALRFLLRRCCAFTAAHRQLWWGAGLSALSAASSIVEPLAAGRMKGALHLAAALLMTLAMGVLLDAGLVLERVPGDLFGLRRWFVGSWIWLTGSTAVLGLLDALVTIAPTAPTGSRLETLVGTALTLPMIISGLSVIPSTVSSVMLFARAAGPARAEAAPGLAD
jgi:hypothetical protein